MGKRLQWRTTVDTVDSVDRFEESVDRVSTAENIDIPGL